MEKTAGKELKCRRCGAEAVIYLADSRYRVFCVSCGEDTYLKTYNSHQRPKIAITEAIDHKKVECSQSDINNAINEKQGILI